MRSRFRAGADPAAAAKGAGEEEQRAALASLATEDAPGLWLARNWGILADVPPELLDQIDL